MALTFSNAVKIKIGDGSISQLHVFLALYLFYSLLGVGNFADSQKGKLSFILVKTLRATEGLIAIGSKL